MSEATPSQGTEADQIVAASATQEFMDAQPAATLQQGTEEGSVDQAPAKKWAGRFDSPDEMETSYKASLAQASKDAPLINQARTYETVLATLDDDPTFKSHVLSFFDKGATEAPQQAALADEYGQINPQAVEGMVEKMVEERLTKRMSEGRRQADLETQLGQLQQKYELSDDQLREVVGQFPSLSVEQMFLGLQGQSQLTKAAARGRGEVFDQINRNANRAPAIGVQPGAGEPQESAEERMAKEILQAGQKSTAEVNLGI